MKKLFFKIFLFSIPAILFITLYVIVDPFKVVRNYDSYISEYVMLHRGFTSTKMFLKNEPKYHFNSYIFGSSTSCAHRSHEWEKYLTPHDKAFSFGSWNESIEGIYGKIKLIDDAHAKIDNALIIIDTDRTFKESVGGKGDYYKVSGLSELEFHYRYFKQFLKLNLIITSIDYTLFHTRRSYMKNFIGMKNNEIDSINNDWVNDSDYDIIKDSIANYENGVQFYVRPKKQQYCERQIDEEKLKVLKNIQSILKKKNTNCIVVIAPLYDQKKLHPDDISILQQIFGADHIYDFSGINKFTESIFNYTLDVSHYRHRVGNSLYKEIYSKPLISKTNLDH